MPSKTDTIAIADPFLDRRVKLLPCQREMVHWWYANGTPIRQIAKIFSVDKRLIQFELFPERKAKNISDRHDRGGSKIYYKGGKEWAETIKNHRHYKKDVFNKT